MLVIALAASACGAESCVDFAEFGCDREELLRGFLILENGLPSHDTFSRASVTFHTSPEIKARLDVLATRARRSMSLLSNEAVERYLTEEEDFIRDVEAGIAAADAGHLIDHAEAATFRRSLGTHNSLPMPKPASG